MTVVVSCRKSEYSRDVGCCATSVKKNAERQLPLPRSRYHLYLISKAKLSWYHLASTRDFSSNAAVKMSVIENTASSRNARQFMQTGRRLEAGTATTAADWLRAVT